MSQETSIDSLRAEILTIQCLLDSEIFGPSNSTKMVSWFDPTYLAADFPLKTRLKLLEYDVLNTYQENDGIVHSLTEILLDRIFLLLAVFTKTRDFKSPSQLMENLTKIKGTSTSSSPSSVKTAGYNSYKTAKSSSPSPKKLENACCQTNIVSPGLKLKNIQTITSKMAKIQNLPILSDNLTDLNDITQNDQILLDTLIKDLSKIERNTSQIMAKFSPIKRKNEMLESEIKSLTQKVKNLEKSTVDKENEMSKKLEKDLNQKDQVYGLERKHQQLEFERKIKNLTDQVKVLQKQNDAIKTDVQVASKTGLGY